MKHEWFKCECHRTGCQFCDGGLGACVKCGGFEGSLPTDCPGVSMTQEQQDKVYAGDVNYRAGEWRNEPSFGVSSHYRKPLGETT